MQRCAVLSQHDARTPSSQHPLRHPPPQDKYLPLFIYVPRVLCSPSLLLPIPNPREVRHLFVLTILIWQEKMFLFRNVILYCGSRCAVAAMMSVT
jgi:hypothetical protein